MFRIFVDNKGELTHIKRSTGCKDRKCIGNDLCSSHKGLIMVNTLIPMHYCTVMSVNNNVIAAAATATSDTKLTSH